MAGKGLKVDLTSWIKPVSCFKQPNMAEALKVLDRDDTGGEPPADRRRFEADDPEQILSRSLAQGKIPRSA